jgi:hypothetical protein
MKKIIIILIFLFLVGCTQKDLNNSNGDVVKKIESNDHPIGSLLWKLNTDIYITINDEVLFSSMQSLDQYFESKNNFNDLYKLQEYYNDEFFKDKDLLLIGFNTCRSEIDAGEIIINQIKADDSGYKLIFDMSSPEENTDDKITLPYIIEIDKANIINDIKPINIYINNKLSNDCGSVYYPIEFPVELPTKYLITFETNGGILQNNSMFVYQDKDYVLPIPTKIEYLFAGWYDELDNEVTSGTWIKNTDITIEAKWEKAEDFIFYNVSILGDDKIKSGYYISEYLGQNIEIDIPLYYNSIPIIGIGTYAFKDNNILERINITSNIIKVSENAFIDCPQLKELNIGKGLKKANSKSFFGLTLDKIKISEDNNYFYGVNTLIEKSTEKLLKGTNNSIIDDYNIKIIGEFSFSNLVDLMTITVPSSVTYIEKCAFMNCSDLSVINLSHNIINIDFSAFSNCESLENITLPNNLINIDDFVFSGCTSLKEITIPSNVQSIGAYNFKDCTSLEKITFSEGVTTTGLYTFHNCVSLKSLSFPSTLSFIGANIIEGCTNIESLTVDEKNPNMYSKNNCIITTWKTLLLGCNSSIIPLEDGIVSIREYAFYKCKELTEIVIPDTVTSFGRGVFTGCTNLSSVTLGRNLKSIGDGVFSDCQSLEKIVLPQQIESIGWMAFSGCSSLNEIYLPASLKSIQKNVFTSCVNISKVEVDPNNEVYYSEGNCVIEKASKTLVYGCKSTIIPEGVLIINAESFSGCSGLTSLYIPSSVVTINPDAFWNCDNIKDITVNENNSVYYSVNYCLIDRTDKTLVIGTIDSIIPDDGSVTKIGPYAFNYCRGLQSITIPDTITEIGRGTFYGCFNLETVNISSNLIKIDDLAFMYCDKLKNIILPNTLLHIGDSAFSNCKSIESIFIPIMVEYMGQNAFSSMNNAIIYCEASNAPKDWYDNFYSTGAKVYWDCQR